MVVYIYIYFLHVFVDDQLNKLSKNIQLSRSLYCIIVVILYCKSGFLESKYKCKQYILYYCLRTFQGPKSNFVPKGIPLGFEMA